MILSLALIFACRTCSRTRKNRSFYIKHVPETYIPREIEYKGFKRNHLILYLIEERLWIP